MGKGRKQVKQPKMICPSTHPKHIENPESFYSKNPVWSFKLLDNTYHKWGFIHTNNINKDIITKLIDYEKLTWGEIIKATGGRKYGNNNHYESISKLTTEAQIRWKKLKLEEYDSVFSLRLTGTHRLYGLLSDGIFKIIWYDQHHEIYPLKN